MNSSPGLGALTGATFSGLVTANGGITLAGTTTVRALTASGIVDVTNTTDASDATGDTGALRCEGGASIAKKLYVGTDLDVDGTTNLDAVDVDGNFTLDGNVAGANSITRIAYSHSGLATVASNQVNSTPTIFVCTSEPTATSNGDIWIDIS